MLIRVKYTKDDAIKYLSHLDIMRAFFRGIRMAQIPILYSKGYNPHPKISFGPPLPVGVSSNCEYADFQLGENIKSEELKYNLNIKLPYGIRIKKAQSINEKGKSLTEILNASLFDIKYKTNKNDYILISGIINEVNSRNQFYITKKKKKKGRPVDKRVDIKPFIKKLEIVSLEKDLLTLKLVVISGIAGSVNPITLMKAIKEMSKETEFPSLTSIKRIFLYNYEGEQVMTE